MVKPSKSTTKFFIGLLLLTTVLSKIPSQERLLKNLLKKNPNSSLTVAEKNRFMQNTSKTFFFLKNLDADPNLRVFELSWLNGETVGKYIGIGAKILQLIFILIMIVDVISRSKGKNLNSMHLMRYVTFTYCASITFLLGYQRDGFSGFHQGTNSQLLSEFYNRIYYGYYENTSIKIFNEATVDGQKFGFIYTNSLFLEVVIYLILSILSYFAAGGLSSGKKALI